MFSLDTITLDHKALLKRLKWQRFVSHPLRIIRRRLGFDGEPVHWKQEIMRDGRRLPALADCLASLPEGFFTSYSLPFASAVWLYREVVQRRPGVVAECGSGLSTIAVALALKELGSPARFLSLESDRHWLSLAQGAVDRLGLAPYVELLYAPIRQIDYHGRTLSTYDMSGLQDCAVDFLFVDGPPPEYGRTGVVLALSGRLSDKSIIVLDDACRDTERKCAEMWVRECGVSLLGYVPIGHGLAVLEKIHGN
jgi:hypothetical protein